MLWTQITTITKVKGKGLSLIFQIEKDKIVWFKNKNIITKNKNTRCVRPTRNQIFIMLTYTNMNMKKTWQGYGARSCLNLMLNILNEMKGLTPIYIPLGN